MVCILDVMTHQEVVDCKHRMIVSLSLVLFSSAFFLSFRSRLECRLYVHPKSSMTKNYGRCAFAVLQLLIGSCGF